MSKAHEIYGLDAGVSFEGDEVDWRSVADPDGEDDGFLENDEPRPTPQYVIDVLGFDPNEEFLSTNEEKNRKHH